MGVAAMGALPILSFSSQALKILEYYKRLTQKFVIEVVAGPIYLFLLGLTARQKSD
jgi:hypothetical protein